jgi:hypothetical protein
MKDAFNKSVPVQDDNRIALPVRGADSASDEGSYTKSPVQVSTKRYFDPLPKGPSSITGKNGSGRLGEVVI